MAMIWEKRYARRAERMRSSDIRDAFKLAEDPTVISLAGGFPSPETFRLEAVASHVDRILRTDGGAALQYGPTEGLLALREWIADYMARSGVPTEPGEVLITHGSQQGLDLLGKLF